MLNKIISNLTWVIILLLSLISILVAIAQRSVPGNPTFGIKIGFERALLAFYSIFDKQTSYQFVLTNNRYIEVHEVLTSHYALEGLDNLNAQVIKTKQTIEDIKNPQERTSAAGTYITQLSNLSSQLNTDKQVIQSTRQPANQPSNKPSIVPTVAPTSGQSQPSVVSAINETQGTIQDTISTLSKLKNENKHEDDSNNKNNKNEDKKNNNPSDENKPTKEPTNPEK